LTFSLQTAIAETRILHKRVSNEQARRKGDYVNEYEALLQSSIQRRAFLSRMSSAGLGALATSLLGGTLLSGCNGDNDNGGPSIPNPTASPSPTPGSGVDPQNFPGIIGRTINEVVLNYALSLETIEADLYRQALNRASGKPLETPLNSDPNTYNLAVPPGSLNTASGQVVADAFAFLKSVTYTEASHRQFLLTTIRALGGTPQPPNPGGYRFPNGPGNDLKTILTNVGNQEEIGQRAYLGAAPFLTDLGLVQAAATIHSVECRHAAVIGDAIGRDPGPVPRPGDQRVVENYPSPNTFEYFLPPRQVLQLVPMYFNKGTTTT
jgi:hypothetical protein